MVFLFFYFFLFWGLKIIQNQRTSQNRIFFGINEYFLRNSAMQITSPFSLPSICITNLGTMTTVFAPKQNKKKNIIRRLSFGCYYYRRFPVHSSGLVPRPLALHAEGPGSILTSIHQCNIIFMSIFYIKYIVTPMIFFFRICLVS